MDSKELIGRLTVIEPDVNTISGTVTKGAASDAVFTEGSVYYLDKSLLRPFASGRAAMQRICRQNGVRFLSGWAIPDTSLTRVLDELEKQKKDIEKQIQAFLVNLPHAMSAWEALHPEVTPWKSEFPTINQVARKMRVSIGVYKIVPDPSAGGDVINEASNLSERALAEIAQDVRLSWDPSRAEATQRVKGIFRRSAAKLRGLAVLDARLPELANAIDAAVSKLPQEGKILGADFLVLSGLMGAMGSLSSLKRALDGIGAGDPQALWSDVAALTTAGPEQAVAVDAPEPPVTTGAPSDTAGQAEPQVDDGPVQAPASPEPATAAAWSW